MRTDENLKQICDLLQQNMGDLHAAARGVGLSPHFISTWMRDDEVAAKDIAEAQRVGWMGLESEAIRRGVLGVEEDVYYKGEVVGQKVAYSDGLLTKMLEARVPAFKKGEQGSSTFNGPTQINIMPRAANYDEWLAMKKTTLEEREQAALPPPSAQVPEILQGDYVEFEEEAVCVQGPLQALAGLL